MRIGILGGTFDPIHYGHLIVAEEARIRFQLDEVVFIPARIPPHKTQWKITPAEQRFEMVRLAISGNPDFSASDIEIRRNGYSYSIDTVQSLLHRGEIFLIMGTDSFQQIETWLQYKRLLRMCSLLIVRRPDAPEVDVRSFSKEMQEYLASHSKVLGDVFDHSGKTGDGTWVYYVPIPGLNISATEIRHRVRNGVSIRYLVPERVIEFISRFGLYRHRRGGKASE